MSQVVVRPPQLVPVQHQPGDTRSQAPGVSGASNTVGKRLGLALGIISAAQLMIVLDSTIVNSGITTTALRLHGQRFGFVSGRVTLLRGRCQ